MDRMKRYGIIFILIGLLQLVVFFIIYRHSWPSSVLIPLPFIIGGVVYLIIGIRREKKQNDKG